MEGGDAGKRQTANGHEGARAERLRRLFAFARTGQPSPYGTAPDSLGRIIPAFKALTTNAYIRGVNRHGWPPFPGRLWQRNYYERIIRNDDEWVRARRYIEENLVRWHLDKENLANIP